MASEHRRTVLRGLLLLGALLLVWLVAAPMFFLTVPTTEHPRTEVLYVLGSESRIEVGLTALDRGEAEVLVLSAANPQREICRTGYRGHLVLCPQPDPMTTQGEAIQLSELAAAYGWTDITVVTHRAHLRRTSILMERCYDGPLRYRDDGVDFGWPIVLRQLLYETGAMVKTMVTPGCRQTLG
ncbi:YdcF family protein [Parenemella sanctibonifatiensis]|uniref:DUF218 domain-containing protein n=1 Tax=Parenemella sanctibonifatiensis TaxID=2016505 RepID=A0A255E8T2_9ACTN|nr:hypothetical protein [Parenemella sanctibonifatiensis]OYN87977.1 hypothetical protein CGZ92_06910 [Parenemella sanctibonifatiensis]